jgi:hypothetical protein
MRFDSKFTFKLPLWKQPFCNCPQDYPLPKIKNMGKQIQLLYSKTKDTQYGPITIPEDLFDWGWKCKYVPGNCCKHKAKLKFSLNEASQQQVWNSTTLQQFQSEEVSVAGRHEKFVFFSLVAP